MRIFLFLIVSFHFLSGQDRKIYPGETIEYDIKYGIIDAGNLSVYTSKSPIQDSIGTFYQIKVIGETAKAFSSVAKIYDVWMSYVDTISLKPFHFQRIIKENSYYLDEHIYFDRKHENVTVISEKGQERSYHFEQYPLLDTNAMDMISSYLKIRTLPFKRIKANDTLSFPVFYENDNFVVNVIYRGTEKTRTALGKRKCYVIQPLLPESTIFRGDYPVTVWVSADKFKIPVKLRAKIKVGNAYVELAKYNGIRGKKLRNKFQQLTAEN